MLTTRRLIQLAVAASALAVGAASQAASVYLACPAAGTGCVDDPLPASLDVDLGSGTTTLELYMDFTGEPFPTVGGGVDFDASGMVSIASFTPSAFFDSLDDVFSGHGTATADNDYEVHVGEFSGISADVHHLGTFTINLLNVGAGQITLAINSTWGEFFPACPMPPGSCDPAQPITVALSGAQVNVVPLPATAWLFATGFGIAAFWRRYRT